MRIEQSNQYFQNIGLGANSKTFSEKAIFRTYSRSATAEAGGIADGKQGASPITQFERANNNAKPQVESEDSLRSQLVNATKRILGLQVDPVTKKVGNEWVLENEEEYLAAGLAISAVMDEKAELMNEYLKEMGIKGEVTAMSGQTFPNIYTEYYVETEGDGKNLFILELENGELVFAETDRRMAGSYDDSHSWAWDFAKLQYDLYGGQRKLSDNELKTLYAKFFDVEEMKSIKDYASEYAKSHEYSALSDVDETKDLVLDLKSSEEKFDASETPETSEPSESAEPYVSPLRKAIKDYQDEMLTGLTEDERKEIEAKLIAFRKECIEAGMDAKAMQTAVNNYYKSLLKEYGAKFDIEDTGNANGAEAASATSPGANTVNKTDMKTEVQTDPDGTVYLLITTPNGISMKIKIGNDGNSEDGALSGVQKAKKHPGVADYEKNIDDFFEEKNSTTLVS